MRTVVDQYSYGDIAIIRNYSIFDPSPHSWNTKTYGTGMTYLQGDKYAVSSDLMLYGMYDDAFVTYYYFDRTCDRWQTQFGSLVTVGEYLIDDAKLESFTCWLVDSKPVFPNSYVSLTRFNLDMFPSCDWTSELRFDANGGIGPTPQALSADCHMHMEKALNEVITIHDFEDLVLPACSYVRPGFEFSSWKINDKSFQPGEIASISANAVAYAEWKYKVTYDLDVTMRLTTGSPRKASDRQQQQFETEYGIVIVDEDRHAKWKTLHATAKSDFTFVKWTLPRESTNPTLDFTCSDSITDVDLTFKSPSTYQLFAVVQPEGFGTVMISDTAKSNVKRATANPAYGCIFQKWLGVAQTQQMLNPIDYTFTGEGQQTHTLTAVFSPSEYLVKIHKGNEVHEVILTSNCIYASDVRNGDPRYVEDMSITKVELGSAITEIGDRCFLNCKSLETINLKNITKLGEYCFSHTSITSIVLGAVTVIPKYAFYECRRLQLIQANTDITQLKVLDYAFQYCSELVGVFTTHADRLHMPKSVGAYAFSGCRALTTAIFTSAMKYDVAPNAFADCEKLQLVDLTVFDSNQVSLLENISTGAFGSISSSPANRIFKFKDAIAAEQVISRGLALAQYQQMFQPHPASGVTKFKLNHKRTNASTCKITVAFDSLIPASFIRDKVISWGDNTTTEITIKDTAKTYSYSHAYNKIGVYEASVPDVFTEIKIRCGAGLAVTEIMQFGYHIKTLPARALEKAEITSLKLPNTIEFLGQHWLHQVTTLTSGNVDVEDGFVHQNSWVVLKNGSMFSLFGSASDASLRVPAEVKKLEAFCLHNCPNLMILELPSGIEQIDADAFGVNRRIQEVRIYDVGKYGEYDVRYEHMITYAGYSVAVGFNGADLLQLPNSYTAIEDKAFKGCNNISYSLPAGISHIGNMAFSANEQLTSIEFKNPQFTTEKIRAEYDHWCDYCGGDDFSADPNVNIRCRNILFKCAENKNLNLYAFNVPGLDAFDSLVRKTTAVIIVANEGNLKNMSRDVDDLKAIVTPWAATISVFKNKNAKVNDVKKRLTEYVRDYELVIFIYSGHGGRNGETEYMILADGNLTDSAFWNIVSYAAGRVMCIFACCHAGGMLKTASNSLLEVNVSLPGVDFGQTAKKFFAASDSNAQPPILAWSACKNTEVSWALTQPEYDSKGDWYSEAQRVGSCFIHQILVSFSYNCTYETLWDRITDGQFATMNQHHIEFHGDYDKFKSSTPKDSWFEWNGPTPTKTVLNGFNEKQTCFT